ncbi:MAG: amidohydrolase family protein, partial [Gammaproteobacteria bacterium]|nr:amidohydrolase family protein [Gammaproteobacteria bacterium]
HNHQYHVGLLTYRGVNLQGIASLQQMYERLQSALRQAAPGETIYSNMTWSPDDLNESRGPSLAELDRIAPENPVVVFETRSRIYLNTYALKALGVTADTESSRMLTINRNGSGIATGLITGIPASVLLFAGRIVPQPDMEEKKSIIKRTQAMQHGMGLTGIRDLQLYPDVMRAYYELWRNKELTMRVSMGLELNAGEEHKLDAMLAPWGVGAGFGDEWLRIDGIAEYNPGDRVRAPYSDSDGTDTGKYRLDERDFINAIRKINQYGWRPAIHVAGDRTLDLVLDAYEAANRERSIRDRRWIVEHIQLVHDEQIERIKNLGVLVSAQFQPYLRAAGSIRRWGKQRFENAMRIKDLMDSGIIVSGGSDWPGAPNNPFINIYYYVTRDTLDLGSVGEDQKISRQDAIMVMSLNNAYMMFNEQYTGSITPGKFADFVIIEEDILNIPALELLQIKPLATIVNGKTVYSAPNSGF